MGITILRPGQRLLVPGVRVIQPSMASVSSWWLSGGISAANAIVAYAAKGAADLAASYINLANPGTFNASPGVAPTFNTADGWTFNGSTQYLTTGAIPATGWSMIIRVSSATAGRAAGMASGGNFFSIRPNDGSGSEYGNGAGVTVVAPVLTTGVTAVAGQQGYRNGTAEGAALTAWSGASSVAIYLGCRNVGGAANSLFNGKIQALAIYNTTLSGAQITALTTAINLL